MNTTLESQSSKAECNSPAAVLSVDQIAELLQCEATIRRGLGTFVEVGFALARIRDSKLYRAEFGTFEEYCAVKWDMSARRALQLRDAAAVCEVLRDQKFAVLPVNESQARPLTELPREEWGPAWEEVVGTGKPTANHVAAVVQRRMDRMKGKVNPDTDRFKRPEPAKVDAGTREERARALASQAQAALRELQDTIGTADGMPTANVKLAIQQMDDLQDHLARKEQLLGNRQKEPHEQRT